MTFQRISNKARSPDRDDTTGTIRVVVYRVSKTGSRGQVQGSLSRTLTVHETKVSDVFAAIEGSLFGGSHGADSSL